MVDTWEKRECLLAYPSGWQRPAKTEEWAYEQCVKMLQPGVFSQVVCFPWASLIDLMRARQSEKAKPFLNALEVSPPRDRLIRATVCQHIYAKDMLPWFRRLKITDLFWSHATVNEDTIAGIRVHPFPLFPVQCADLPSDIDSGGKRAAERRLLYSFVGAYDPSLYLSAVRQWIFDLPNRADAFLAVRGEWHYERHVYGEQVAGRKIDEQSQLQHERHSREYSEVLRDSVFSLCPSGSGPNSIRLWESLGFGAIPVILADTLRLPGSEREWEEGCIRVREDEGEVRRLPSLLEEVARDKERLNKMQAAGRVLWEKYGRQGPLTILRALTDTTYVARLIG